MADRIIAQVAAAQVWPRPKDASDQVIQAVLTMAEMAPQNATEAMLAVQMIAANSISAAEEQPWIQRIATISADAQLE